MAGGVGFRIAEAFIDIRANNLVMEGLAAAMAGVRGFASGSETALGGAKLAFAGLGIAAGIAAVAAVKMAADFEASTERLVASAGESHNALEMVRQGILDMAGAVGDSPEKLSEGLYRIEGAGYHGADGLTILKAAAQGAKAENADLGTVANGVTDILKDYHLGAEHAADVTSKLVVATSHSTATFQEFSGSLHNVLPLAGAMGISVGDISGSLAEMTTHGVSADQASQNLQNAMIRLAAPTKKMQTALSGVGISADDLKKSLSENGLAGTMEMISQRALRFGAEGSPQYVEAMRKMMGTAPGLQAALMTTGENFKETTANIREIDAATADASGDVKGFAGIQDTLNQSLARAGAGFEALAIKIGSVLLPILKPVASAFADMVGWISQNNGVAVALAAVIGGVIVVALSAAAVAAWGFAAAMLANPAVWIVAAIVVAVGLLVAAVAWLINNWSSVTAFFAGLWQSVTDIFNAAMGWIGSALTWLQNLPATVMGWLADLPYNIGYMLGSLIGILLKLGIDALTAMASGIATGAVAVWDFITALPGKVLDFLVALPGNLLTFGVNALHSMATGITDGAAAVWAFIQSIPGRILGFLGNLGGLLLDAGRAIISGLLNGLKNAVGALWDFVSGIAAGIAARKGPLDYDKTLLTPHGNAIMDGLLGGLKSGHERVIDFVSGVAGSVAEAVGDAPIELPMSVPVGFSIASAASLSSAPAQFGTATARPAEGASTAASGGRNAAPTIGNVIVNGILDFRDTSTATRQVVESLREALRQIDRANA